MTMVALFRTLVLTTLAVSLIPGAARAQVPEFDAFYVFGDSLADTGNVLLTSGRLGADPAPPPSESPHLTYFEGRFSNGWVAFEYLWETLSGHAPGSAGGLVPIAALPDLRRTAAVNFAFGGTGTPYLDQTPGGMYAPGLAGQIELFRHAVRGRRPSRNALYAIVTGANDYRVDAFNQPMRPEDVVRNIVESVKVLFTLGARTVVVLNMPDLGLLPGGGGAGSPASQLSAHHNRLLSEELAALSRRLRPLRIVPVDVNVVFRSLIDQTDGVLDQMNSTIPALDVFFPPEYLPPGFRMSLCLFIDPATCQDVPFFETNAQYLFWDVVHPTTDAHRVLAQHVYDALRQ